MAKHDDVRQFHVQLPEISYPVIVGQNLLFNTQLLRRYVAGQQVFVVTNHVVAPLYLNLLLHAFSDRQVDFYVVNDGESYKNHQSLDRIYDALISQKHHRDTTIIALGGGVIGDLAGFAASTYQRGVRFIQIPTTLLAQVDASIGGKTAINFQHFKNAIGSFYQPHAVLIDVSTLNTLPRREMNSAFAEIIKYGLLVGGDFFRTVSRCLEMDRSATPVDDMMALIFQSCEIKASYIVSDERENGERALLNLGHTFAHALEAITNYQKWLHGEAVGIGIFCAVLLSYHLGYLDKVVVHQVDQLLQMAQLPRRIPKDIDLNRLHELMYIDKKIKHNQLRFVLMRAIGDCFLDANVSETSLRQVMLNVVEGEYE